LVNRLNERVYEMLKPEAERPFDHYSFWSVPQNALVPEDTLNVSPLAQLALKTTVPGVIGYFQIDPDGSFHSPVLPELNLNGVSGRQDTPLSHDEVNRRVGLKAKLHALLNQGGASLAEEPEAELALRGAEASDRASTQESAKAPGPGKPKKTADLKLDEDLYRRQEALPKRPGYAQGRDARLEKKALPQAPRTETSIYLGT
jgi:two-component system, OmpR family, phosphate regulon sensor histidine kinase PhoR